MAPDPADADPLIDMHRESLNTVRGSDAKLSELERSAGRRRVVHVRLGWRERHPEHKASTNRSWNRNRKTVLRGGHGSEIDVHEPIASPPETKDDSKWVTVQLERHNELARRSRQPHPIQSDRSSGVNRSRQGLRRARREIVTPKGRVPESRGGNPDNFDRTRRLPHQTIEAQKRYCFLLREPLIGLW
jgi:hypothetical protein